MLINTIGKFSQNKLDINIIITTRWFNENKNGTNDTSH
jgi:hypothetical protein